MLSTEEKEALGLALKFRIPVLLDIELNTADGVLQGRVRSQLDALVSAAIKLELP